MIKHHRIAKASACDKYNSIEFGVINTGALILNMYTLYADV